MNSHECNRSTYDAPWTVETLTNLLVRNGYGPRLHRRIGTLFAIAYPLPQTGRPGEPIHPPTPCLVWRGGLGTGGYGRIFGSYVHRIVLSLIGRDVPDGLVAAHACERPACANPDHIRVLPQVANTREGGLRKYPDWLLAMAPTVECEIHGPMDVTISIGRKGRPRWGMHCAPCHGGYARALRARRRTGDEGALPWSGQKSLAMDDDALQALTEYSRSTHGALTEDVAA